MPAGEFFSRKRAAGAESVPAGWHPRDGVYEPQISQEYSATPYGGTCSRIEKNVFAYLPLSFFDNYLEFACHSKSAV